MLNQISRRVDQLILSEREFVADLSHRLRTPVTALRGNADVNRVLLMDRRDTGFAGAADDVPDEEVINAIKSVPCHY